MRKIAFLLLLVISSCEVYQEPKLLSLSGEYVVDKITKHSTDNSTSSNDIIYVPGDIYINPEDIFPTDSINVGFTRWHLDYSIISFFPYQNQNGQTIWQRQYYYDIVNHNSIYDLGYLKFQSNGSVRIFKILDDAAESITLRTSGLWPYSNIGPNQSVTIHLTRIGP
jgi:hypothetical protein